jgi:site-specific recombinase XerD
MILLYLSGWRKGRVRMGSESERISKKGGNPGDDGSRRQESAQAKCPDNTPVVSAYSIGQTHADGLDALPDTANSEKGTLPVAQTDINQNFGAFLPMVRTYHTTFMKAVDEYLAWLVSRNRAETTIVDYRFTLNQFDQFLADTEGMSRLPHLVGQKEVAAFLKLRERKVGAKYYQTQVRQLRGFFRYIKNPAMDQMYLEFSEPPRPNVIWLSKDETKRLLKAMETPLENLVVHLGLELGLRMIEMRRLRVQDFYGPTRTIQVRGKGRNGGKWRTLPYHQETERILQQWLQERSRLVEYARERDPNVEVPEQLIIYWNRKWKLGTYTKTGMLRILKALVKRARINPLCAYHSLRRTFGRTMYINGVGIESIAKLLGHSDTQTTLLYIGINIDDMSDALKKGAKFR